MHNTDIFKIDLTDCFSDFSFIMPFTDKITFRKKQTVLLPLPLPDKYLPRPTPLLLLHFVLLFYPDFSLSRSFSRFRFRYLFSAAGFYFTATFSHFRLINSPAPPSLRFFPMHPLRFAFLRSPAIFQAHASSPQHGTIFLPIKKTPSASGSGVLKDKKMIIYAVLANATATSLSLLNRRTANDT